MISYFKTLFEYDRHTSLVMLDLMEASGAAGKPVSLMAHMMTAQQTWLLRCKQLPAPGGPLWPDTPIDQLKGTIEQNHTEWMAYLDGLQDGDMDNAIAYKTTRGEEFTNTVRDIVAHVINHGTHHRAQIGMHLRSAGVEQLPITDLIMYIRSKQ